MTAFRKRKAKDRAAGRLTPLEIQSQMGGGKTPTTSMDGKIIRFYASITPREIMDDLTIDDLKAAGFVAYRYKGTKDPKILQFTAVEHPTKLVHSSVPVAYSIDAWQMPNYAHPTIGYEIGYGWEAKYGAVRYGLRNEKELHAFMKRFNYPITNP